MPDFLIITLQGGMQAWGTHTYEDYRPSLIFPTRSGIVGLLAACLGIKRDDLHALKQLNDSIVITVRVNKRKVENRHMDKKCRSVSFQKITDYHTVLDARKVDGGPRKDAIVSRREYLFDAEYTLALTTKPQAAFSLEQLFAAAKKPLYTPFLGRRSCPLHQPLVIGEFAECLITADNVQLALQQVEPFNGVLYSETELPGSTKMTIRDDAAFLSETRQFNNRNIYILGGGESDVSE